MWSKWWCLVSNDWCGSWEGNSFPFAVYFGENPPPYCMGVNNHSTVSITDCPSEGKGTVPGAAGPPPVQGDRDAWKASPVGLGSPSPHTRASPSELLSQQAEWLCCSVLWLPGAAGGRICLLQREGALTCTTGNNCWWLDFGFPVETSLALIKSP